MFLPQDRATPPLAVVHIVALNPRQNTPLHRTTDDMLSLPKVGSSTPFPLQGIYLSKGLRKNYC